MNFEYPREFTHPTFAPFASSAGAEPRRSLDELYHNGGCIQAQGLRQDFGIMMDDRNCGVPPSMHHGYMHHGYMDHSYMHQQRQLHQQSYNHNNHSQQQQQQQMHRQEETPFIHSITTPSDRQPPQQPADSAAAPSSIRLRVHVHEQFISERAKPTSFLTLAEQQEQQRAQSSNASQDRVLSIIAQALNVSGALPTTDTRLEQTLYSHEQLQQHSSDDAAWDVPHQPLSFNRIADSHAYFADKYE
uniref:Uncharacterized protein n=1 Tax=Craspedostauros australis TaxID=1486917 RepID=A0A7R9ZK16_9STRA|eukprot:CAMPEP_0198127322 /NCGR_PEP_ID=MMETSP1442-20131203/46887_1 /TAXON_ID= /ORGANISM="Craspedostauros australis, Strain CCMP3328" /LENGTH=244 /DNA_ID=CAMNT_0043787273 /DNA_START=93 /DNA_END=827 /DNA_ORIENTATION=-